LFARWNQRHSKTVFIEKAGQCGGIEEVLSRDLGVCPLFRDNAGATVILLTAGWNMGDFRRAKPCRYDGKTPPDGAFPGLYLWVTLL
jgi:hypothetical protein